MSSVRRIAVVKAKPVPHIVSAMASFRYEVEELTDRIRGLTRHVERSSSHVRLVTADAHETRNDDGDG
jgi:hypothetical protein